MRTGSIPRKQSLMITTHGPELACVIVMMSRCNFGSLHYCMLKIDTPACHQIFAAYFRSLTFFMSSAVEAVIPHFTGTEHQDLHQAPQSTDMNIKALTVLLTAAVVSATSLGSRYCSFVYGCDTPPAVSAANNYCKLNVKKEDPDDTYNKCCKNCCTGNCYVG